MTSARPTPMRYPLLAVLLAASSVAGCGNQGDLYLPAQTLEELREERRDEATPVRSPAPAPAQTPAQPPA